MHLRFGLRMAVTWLDLSADFQIKERSRLYPNYLVSRWSPGLIGDDGLIRHKLQFSR